MGPQRGGTWQLSVTSRLCRAERAQSSAAQRPQGHRGPRPAPAPEHGLACAAAALASWWAGWVPPRALSSAGHWQGGLRPWALQGPGQGLAGAAGLGELRGLLEEALSLPTGGVRRCVCCPRPGDLSKPGLEMRPEHLGCFCNAGLIAHCRRVHLSWGTSRGVPVNWNEELALRAACEDCGEAALSYSWDLFLVNVTGRAREEGTDRIASFLFYFCRESGREREAQRETSM